MKRPMTVASLVVVLLALAGCVGLNSPNTPAFLSSDNVTRIEVTDDQTGQRGLASKDLDNLNELLNMLHLDGMTPSTRMDVPEPASSAYTIVAYDQAQTVWTIRVLDTPQSGRVYLRDAVHPANNGIYPLQQAISATDLDQFIKKYPAPH